MDKDRRIEEIIETNFRLNALQTRELGVEMRRLTRQTSETMRTHGEETREQFGEVRQGIHELGKRVDELGKSVDELGKSVDGLGKSVDGLGKKVDGLGKKVELTSTRAEHGIEAMGELFEKGMNAQADRMDQVVKAIRGMAEGSVDVRKEIEELKRRVKDLEDRAS
jgi:methyl-accepting chemotaxis protein